MDPNLIAINTTFLLDNTTGPISNVQDTTNYAGIGISNSQVKGNVVAKYGATIFHGNPTSPDWTNPDINRATSDNISFFLPLDSLQKVINAAYAFIYTILITAENLFANAVSGAATQIATTIPATLTTDQAAFLNSLLADTSKTNVTVHFYVGGSLKASSLLASHNTTTHILFASVDLGTSYATIDNVIVTADSIYQKEFDYNFCNKTPQAELSVQGDFLRSQLTVRDITNYPANLTSSTRVLKIAYPNYSNGTPTAAPVSTSASAITIGPDIFSGSYHASLTTQIKYTQTDALNVQDTVSGYEDYQMNYNGSLCSLSSCISSLRSTYISATNAGSANAGELFRQNIYVLLAVNDYNIAISCGNSGKAISIVNDLATYLKQNVGCDCGCDDNLTIQGEPRIIYAAISSNLTSNLLTWN